PEALSTSPALKTLPPAASLIAECPATAPVPVLEIVPKLLTVPVSLAVGTRPIPPMYTAAPASEVIDAAVAPGAPLMTTPLAMTTPVLRKPLGLTTVPVAWTVPKLTSVPAALVISTPTQPALINPAVEPLCPLVTVPPPSRRTASGYNAMVPDT